MIAQPAYAARTSATSGRGYKNRAGLGGGQLQLTLPAPARPTFAWRILVSTLASLVETALPPHAFMSAKSKPKAHSKQTKSPARPALAAKSQQLAPVPPPPPRFFIRCTFVGEDKKVRLEGSFRFLIEATDLTAALAKLEKAVNKLRRTKDLPPRCDVYVEFVLELTDQKTGLIADFERWERDPRRFQAGHITVTESSRVFVEGLPIFSFGKRPEPASSAPATSAPQA